MTKKLEEVTEEEFILGLQTAFDELDEQFRGLMKIQKDWLYHKSSDERIKYYYNNENGSYTYIANKKKYGFGNGHNNKRQRNKE